MTVIPAPLPRVQAPRPKGSRLYGSIAETAHRALLAELAAWPKPGLVSHVDNGSHRDMNAAMLRVSAEVLRPFFMELALAGSENSQMGVLRAIGVRAEEAMLKATGGVNTHRGTIFGLGLLCAAAGICGELSDGHNVLTPRKLGSIVAQSWGRDIRRGPIPLHSHGSAALRRHGAGGARLEAAEGFPSIYQVGLPALRLSRVLAPADANAASVQTCFALIATVQDTNILHRGGTEGATYARTAAATFLANGGVGTTDWQARAAAVHEGFIARRLSPGGCADLLAMTLFVDALEGETAGS